MRNMAKVFWVLGIIMLAAPIAVSKPAAENDDNSIVIIFKDGRQQSFHLSDIARIEFNAPGKSAAIQGRGRFQGRWKAGDGVGGTFIITLSPDGEATKSIGPSHGTWTVVNGEARISWEDGWHDVIRREGGRYHKVAFAPGKSFSDEPANVEDATPMMPN